MNLRESITNFIKNEFLDCNEEESISDDLDLVKSGVVDSLGILRIVVFLEEEMNIVIEPEQMVPKNLSSIGAILNMVNQEPASGC
jgi:acyl carrier protein